MPVANLQTYKTVALRVHSSAFAAQGQAMFLEQATLEDLRKQCGFSAVDRAGSQPADVVLDLNIISTGRGGGGWVTNSNLATVDTLLVLTDGTDGQLLGTAKIHGKSSGMIINNAAPENEAIGAVAKSVADLLAKSGCAGPRIAKVTPPPTDTGTGTGTGTGSGTVTTGTGTGSGTGTSAPDESHRAQAETLNDQGKEKLYVADMAGALALFQQANQLLPDAKYEFNVCIALGAQDQWDQALASCKHARSMNPPAALADKIDRRIDLLQHHQ